VEKVESTNAAGENIKIKENESRPSAVAAAARQPDVPEGAGEKDKEGPCGLPAKCNIL
jgi:hypothetical protein